MTKTVAIIGAGPAGMAAAYFAADAGAQVFLYEKNPVIGKKLIFVPWDGCELTHSGDTDDFMENYARGAEFIRFSLEKFGSKQAIKFFKGLGVELSTNEDGIISPASGGSPSVQKAFETKLTDMGVTFCISSKVQEILTDGKKVPGVEVHNLAKPFDKVIIATGGAARPKLGASGDGYRFAQTLGHNVIDPLPAMSEVETVEKLGKFLGGMSFPKVTISIYQNHTKILDRTGPIAFTEHGVTGNTILFLSGIISRLNDKNKVEIGIDIAPQITRDLLEKELIAKSANSNHYSVGEIITNYIDKRMLPVLSRFFRIQDSKPMSHITNLERKGLLLFLKDFRITVKKVKPFHVALYTSGGVDTSEVNPKTMESNRIKGLYFCGEVLDVDGGPGGYNLHSAFATGFIAGKSAGRRTSSRKNSAENENILVDTAPESDAIEIENHNTLGKETAANPSNTTD